MWSCVATDHIYVCVYGFIGAFLFRSGWTDYAGPSRIGLRGYSMARGVASERVCG